MPLEENVFRNLLGTIEVLASFEQQSSYKKNVPFVHVPDELVAQWDSAQNHFSQDWFFADMSMDLKTSLEMLNLEIGDLRHIPDEEWEDVPKIFELEFWKKLNLLAKNAHPLLHKFIAEKYS